MLESKMSQLPSNIQCVYLQNCLKILGHLLVTPNVTVVTKISSESLVQTSEPAVVTSLIDQDDGVEATEITSEEKPGVEEKSETVNSDEEIVINLAEIQEKLKPFVSSEDLEVQERAGMLLNFIKMWMKLEGKGQFDDIQEIRKELHLCFAGELNPVAAKAQKKVPVPEGLDLDAWINDPPSDSEEEEIETTNVFVNQTSGGPGDFGGTMEKKTYYQPTEDELVKVSQICQSKSIMINYCVHYCSN